MSINGTRRILDTVTFKAPDGNTYTLYCLKEMLNYTGKSIVSTGTTIGTSDVIMSDGVEIKAAKLKFEVLNIVQNQEAADAMNLLPRLAELNGTGQNDDGTLFVMKAKSVNKVTLLELDYGVGGGKNTTLELECGTVTFTE